jgi:hypothetical protein
MDLVPYRYCGVDVDKEKRQRTGAITMSSSTLLKEMFATRSEFEQWRNDRLKGFSDGIPAKQDLLYQGYLGIIAPRYFPAVLVFRWLVSHVGPNSYTLLYDWVNHEDFKSQPAIVERVQQKDGSWVERKVPRRPVNKMEMDDFKAIRGVTLE